MARALVLLTEGAEEMETTIVVDVLRRAHVSVDLAGVEGPEAVTCSRGIRITPDLALDAAETDYDALVLPGGAGGAERLGASAEVGQCLRRQWDNGRIVAAICAAPTALLRHRIGLGRRLTSHPSVRALLQASYRTCDERVVQDDHLITSQSPGTSFEFALKLVERLRGSNLAEALRVPMVL